MRRRGSGLGRGFCVAVVLMVQAIGVPPATGQSFVARDVPGMSRLLDVRCNANGTCLGVGTGAVDEGAVVVLTASGTVGPVRAVPGTRNLWAITCRPNGTCMAVGEGWDSAVFVEIGADGTPGGVRHAPATGLYGVACPTVDTCIAVGSVVSYESGEPSSYPLYVVISNGQAGRSRTFPAGAGGIMTSIACPTATRCVALGIGSIATLSNSNGIWTVALTRAQGSWGGEVGYPRDEISCPTSTVCHATAAGFREVVGGQRGVPAWVTITADGAAGPVQLLSRRGGILYSLSCVAEGTCTLVGQDHTGPIGMSIDVVGGAAVAQTSWTNSHRFQGVSCLTAASCGLAGGAAAGVFAWKGTVPS